MAIKETHILIVGAGIIGLTIARELVRSGKRGITIIEKESRLGVHASGRNSGVLHAGIYYSPHSLKARSCLNGNRLMHRYCLDNGLPIKETGKVIVAKFRSQLPTLHELYNRAKANGAKIDLIGLRRLAQLEPLAKSCEEAIFSPMTAVVDPKKVLSCLREELEASGRVEFLTGCRFLDAKEASTVVTSRGKIHFERFVNAAGAYSDQVAKAFGVGKQYKLIPFKGIYRKLTQSRAAQIRGSIYPVPDIRNPFLGVHFTRNVYDDVYIGPTAIPAFGRENYGILKGIDSEGVEIAVNDAALFIANPQFRSVALQEPRKYLFPFFFRDAAQLVKQLSPTDIVASNKVGIRAQLVDWSSRRLVQDFCLIDEDGCLHILNPVSPAFTSSMDLARKVVAQYF